MKKTFCELARVLVCLSAIADEKIRRYHLLETYYYLGYVEGYIILFLNFRADIPYELPYCNKRTVATHIADLFIGKVT